MTSTDTNSSPATTLGWERGSLASRRAWALDDTDIIAQADAGCWSLFLEHELYGAEWLETLDTWADVLDWVNSQPAAALVCADFA